eukprot:gene25451-1690_t
MGPTARTVYLPMSSTRRRIRSTLVQPSPTYRDKCDSADLTVLCAMNTYAFRGAGNGQSDADNSSWSPSSIFLTTH